MWLHYLLHTRMLTGKKTPSNKTPALTISINIGILEAVVQSCFVKKVLIQMRL